MESRNQAYWRREWMARRRAMDLLPNEHRIISQGGVSYAALPGRTPGQRALHKALRGTVDPQIQANYYYLRAMLPDDVRTRWETGTPLAWLHEYYGARTFSEWSAEFMHWLNSQRKGKR